MSWRISPLGELCDLSIGRTPSRSNPKYWDRNRVTNNVWVSIADMTKCSDRFIFDSKEYLQDSGSRGFPKVRKGTLLLSFKLSIGKLAIAGVDLQTNEAIAAINNLNETEVLRDYLYYFLAGFEWDEVTQGRFKVKGNTLNKKILVQLPIRYPSLERQQKIVEKLDKAFHEIASAEQQSQQIIALQTDIFRYEMQSLLSKENRDWKTVTLGDVCGIRTQLVDPRRSEYRKLIHVGGANIVSKTGDLVELKTALEENLISGKFLFDDSVVLYSKIRPYLMKVSRPEFTGLCSADIYPLTPNRSVLTRDYLYWILLSSHFTDYANSGSARAGMPKVNREHLFSYEMLLPDLVEQMRISSLLDSLWTELFKVNVVVTRKFELLGNLRDSILHTSLLEASQ